MINALKRALTTLPAEPCQSLTWDRGKELSGHVRFAIECGVKVFFADPRSPSQRGTNQKVNGFLRQYFPKSTDLSRGSEHAIQAVARTLNKYLKSVRQLGVVTNARIRPVLEP